MRAAQFALKIIYLIERRFGEGYSRRPGPDDRSRERVPSRPFEKGGGAYRWPNSIVSLKDGVHECFFIS